MCYSDVWAPPGSALSSFDDVHNSLGERLRRLLRQVVPDASRNMPVLIRAGKFIRICRGFWMWCTVGIAFHGDRRNVDNRALCKPLFQIVVFRLASGEAQSPAIIVDDDLNVIRIVEG